MTAQHSPIPRPTPPTRTGQSGDQGGEAYRFDTFRTGLLIDDMRFRRTDSGPGDRVPDFDLPTLDGGRFRSDALGTRPALLIFGSRTCPVTESAGPRLERLHRELGDDVRFVFVNTREAHPGEQIPQPKTFDEKWAHAQTVQDHHGFSFEVAVDDIDGQLHRHLSPKPNSAYLLLPDGTIAYRAHWANDDAALTDAIDAVLAGHPPPRGRSRAMLRPLLRAVGHLPGIVRDGGPKIERDVWHAAAPLAILARVSTYLRPLPIDKRGPVAAACVTLIIGVLTAVVWSGTT